LNSNYFFASGEGRQMRSSSQVFIYSNRTYFISRQ